jgi:hypothetical protein
MQGKTSEILSTLMQDTMQIYDAFLQGYEKPGILLKKNGLGYNNRG